MSELEFKTGDDNLIEQEIIQSQTTFLSGFFTVKNFKTLSEQKISNCRLNRANFLFGQKQTN